MKRLKLTLLFSLFAIVSCFAQTTRYWVEGGTAYGNDGTKWSLTSGGSPIGGTITWQTNDIAIFDANSGSGIVVIINAIGTIGKLQIYGNRTVTIRPDEADNRVLDLNTSGSNTFYLESGSTFIISGLDAATDRYLRLNLNSGTNAEIYGYLKVTDGGGDQYGELTKSSNVTINFYNGSTYEHNSKHTSSDLPVATWNTGSTCKITGITGSLPGNYAQNFHHLTWDCGSQSKDLDFNGNITTINGNFTVANTNNYVLGLSGSVVVNTTIKGDYIQSGGKFALARYAPDNILHIDGNFTLSGGFFYMSIEDGAHTIVNLKGNMSLSSGAELRTAIGTSAYTNFNFKGSGIQTFTNGGAILYYKTHLTVVSPAILDLGGNVLGHYQYSTGDFTLQSGAGIRTSHASGMTATGNASGCIQTMGTRTYDNGGHYTFYTNGSQSTGSGLQSAISGSVTIGSTANTTNLSFSNSTTMSGSLIIVKGSVATSNISYASGATLEYAGNTAQTMGSNEWPSSTVPNLKINNSAGVVMNAGKTVTNNLNLYSGALSIGSNNTLTLHNSSITVTSGSLTGGGLSGITFSGSGSATLPGVSGGLKDLAINRSGATITIGGAVNVTGTLTMTVGSCALGAGSITYGPTAILLYNGSVTQTSGSAEFPTSNQPAQIIFQNSVQVNLHQNRSFAGTIQLNSGSFNLGNYQLNFAGDIQQTNGTIISGTSGHLVLDENASQTMIPGSASVYLLTLNRSGGVYLNGDATVHTTLTLTSGELSIGNYQLTLNGNISKTSGTLTGGNNSSMVFGGSGAATTLPAITLKDLGINRSNGINLGGNVTVKNKLTLSAGTLNIGANTLYLDGIINASGGSIGGSSSTLQINENSLKTSTVLPPCELANLYITRSDGVSMTGNVTVHNALEIYSGNLMIGSFNTLTLNGTLTENTGQLIAGNESSLSIGGSGAILDLGLTDLYNLSLTRPNGNRLNNPLKIWGTFTLANSEIDLNGNAISYGPGGTLLYRGISVQTTSDKEWPEVDGPRNVFIQNMNNVLLHNDRSVPGDLQIALGNFGIRTNTLTIGNNLTVLGSGSLVGGKDSNLNISGLFVLNPINLPQITLNNLTINRTGSGVNLQGKLTLMGTLTLTNGLLQIGNQVLSLRKPIAGELNNLQSNPSSSLEIEGDEPGLNIGPSENIRLSQLLMLTVSNTNANGCTLNGDLTVFGSLIVNGGAKFSVKPGKFLSINGTLICGDDDSFTLESNQDATASLIVNGPSMPAKKIRSQRYIKGYTSNTNGWHMMGTPVDKLKIDESPFYPESDDDLYTYNENENLWINYKVPGNFTHFEKGEGYLIASHVDENKWFLGEIFNFDLTFQNLSLTDDRGWHLLGNPYTSGLRWNDGLWNLTGVNAIAKIWKESIHNYIDLDPLGFIPPHNGFFVRVFDFNNSLTIPQLSRVHTPQNWYKESQRPTLTLTAQSLENNTATVCRVRFDENASDAFDHDMDCSYLSCFQQPSVFYSTNLFGDRLSTNTLPFDEETIVPLYFKKGLSTSYRFDAEGFENFAEGVKIILKDEKLNISTDLMIQSQYNFTSAMDDDPNRFKLIFTGNTGIEESNSPSPFRILAEGNLLHFHLPAECIGRSLSCQVFDLTGRKVFQTSIEPGAGMIAHPITVKGIYIVRILIPDSNRQFTAKTSIF